MGLIHQYGSLGVPQTPKSCDALIEVFKFIRLAYLGAYGTHMFALWVWVGDGTSKTFFSCSITLKIRS